MPALSNYTPKQYWGNTGGQAQVPATNYGQFNRSTAGNAQRYLSGQGLPNVWGGATERFQGMTDKLGNSLFADGTPWNGGGIWGQSRPGPDSPLLGGYLKNLEGGGRNLSDQYIKQAAYAGPNRAGTGVVGGSDPRAQMAYQATKALASQYGQQYGQAYDMASRDWSNLSNLWGQGLGAYSNLANTELGALRGASDYNLGQGNIGAQLNAQNLQGLNSEADNQWKYWKDITDWQRGQQGRDWQTQDRSRSLSKEMNSNRNPWARVEQLQTLVNQDQMTPTTWANYLGQQTRSDQLAQAKGLGSYGRQAKAGWYWGA